MAYIPIPEEKLYYYGELPGTSGDKSTYELSKSNIPDSAKEVLVYLWATTKGDEAFHRYYYRIQTKDGKVLYNQYMNVAASTDVSLNSANLWLPVFKGYGRYFSFSSSFSYYGPMRMPGCPMARDVDGPCCATCAWSEQPHVYKYRCHHVFGSVPSCTDEV